MNSTNLPTSNHIGLGVVDEALRVSEIRYRRLFESARDGILILDAETGEITDVNPFLIELLSCSRADFLRKKLWEVGFFRDIAASKANFIELQNKGYVRYEDLPLETADGRRVDVEFISNVYLENDRNVIQCNIRQRSDKEKQQTLAMQILAALNCGDDGALLIGDLLQMVKTYTGMEAVAIRLHDGDDFPYYVTSGFSSGFVEAEKHLCAGDEAGKVVKDSEGKPILECMCGNVICGRTNPALPFFTEGGSFWSNCTTDLLASTTEKDRQAHTRNRCNGEGYESVALIPLRSGQDIVGLLQLNDHRKGMFTVDMITFFEEVGASIGVALSRQELADRIGALAKFPSENKSPVLRIADDGTLLYANPAALSQLAVWHLEPDRPAPAELMNIMQRWAEIEQNIETECNEQIYSFSVAPVVEGGYTNLYAYDITDQKEAEDELLRSEETLRDTNMLLKKSMDELLLTQQRVIQRERLSALGQMASGIAHDFNNVLMAIVGYSELMLSDPAVLDDRGETRHMLGVILEAGNDARQLVRNLRDICKAADDSEHTLIALSKIIESAISLTMPKWKEQVRSEGMTIEIVTDLHPVPTIKGNEGELREIMINLIINAVDAMPMGGAITCRLFCENNAVVVLEFMDNGTGMDEQTRRHCLEPFFSTKGVHGTGLGLSMVYGIVQRHGGEMKVESKLGSGTTIRMSFPVCVVPIDAAANHKKDAKPRSSLRVLVIDDEERAHDTVAKLLTSDGHYSETTASGSDGLDLFRNGTFDLVITDRAMPTMGGDEVAGEIQKIRPGTPVIMLTGFGDIMKDAGDCPVGVAEIMTKPVTSRELRDVIAGVMSKTVKS